MRIAGKAAPTREKLKKVGERGFDFTELYLEKDHLEDVDERIRICRESDVEVVSVHTPHVSMSEERYISEAARLAREIDAYLVFHSKQILHSSIPEAEEKFDLEQPYGYENNPGVSLRGIQNLILGREHELVLDTAHLFIGEENVSELTRRLNEENSESINFIHLCDSTAVKDGLGFGKGEIDMKKLSRAIKKSGFDGTIVLEVMQEEQKYALEKFRSYIS
jgi:sugar phosphate isomerase/epimerase